MNALLSGEEEIKDLTYLNTEHLGEHEEERKAVFDVYCVNEKGERFLVEMQKAEQRFLRIVVSIILLSLFGSKVPRGTGTMN